MPYDIFEAYIDTSICIVRKCNDDNHLTKYYKYNVRDIQSSIDITKLNYISSKEWLKYGKIFLNRNILEIGDKVWFSSNNIKLGDISKINRGCLPPKEDEKSIIKTDYFNIEWFDNQIFRYVIHHQGKLSYVSYENLKESKPLHIFKAKRILARQLMSRQFRINLTLVDSEFAFKKNIYAIYNLSEHFYPEYILTILNSKLFSYVQVNFNTSLQRDDFPSFSLNDFKNFSIPNIDKQSQRPFIELADIMLDKNKELQVIKSKFLELLKSEFPIEKLSVKLQNWHEHSWAVFLAELKKAKIELRGVSKEDWKERFDRLQSKALEIKNVIDRTDRQIDRLVYELYGLTEEEIKIVEGGA